jgi:hypothetical protein
LRIAQDRRAASEPRVFLRLQLLDLRHEGATPCIPGVGDNRRTGIGVITIGETDFGAGSRLDQDLMPIRHQQAHAIGRGTDPALTILAFAGNTNAHQ